MAISDELQSYLSNIEEYVFDEKKIVTYSWLAKTFGIHSNLSKQLLHTFYDTNSRKGELCATYLLIGFPVSEETHQVLVVKDKDLEEVENRLRLITSKHIYSIQKCTELSDVNALYIADKGDTTESISKGISAIDFNSNERDSALMTKLKLNALPVLPKQPAAPAKKVDTQATNKNKSPGKSTKNDQSSKKTEEDKECNVKTENKNKTSVPAMFKNNTVSKKKPAEKVTVNSKKPQGIGAFFCKTTSKPTDLKKLPESENVKEAKPTVLKVNERLSSQKENKATLNIAKENKNCTKLDDQQESPEKPTKAEVKAKSSSNKVVAKRGKKNSVKKVEKQKEKKKRKRLIVFSDSDSSEEEEEVMREPTPEPEPTVVPDIEVDDDDMIYGTPEPSKKRKKKLVSRSFTSSDGFLVTEKEYVDASCSEDEEAVPEKKFKGESSAVDKPPVQSDSKSETNAAKSSTKGKKESPKNVNTSPQKTKQSSLMNFFKKK